MSRRDGGREKSGIRGKKGGKWKLGRRNEKERELPLALTVMSICACVYL